MPAMRSLTGRRFGKLVVIELLVERDKHGNVRWECRCDCGARSQVTSNRLLCGKANSCGCRSGGPTHGQTHSKAYRAWRAMKYRCLNQRCSCYHNYGGRGITVCERWLNSFENFFADMGLPPRGLQLERKNNDGNYEPGNCVWATCREQSNNRRRTVLLEYHGDIKPITEWADLFRIKHQTIRSRIRDGWGVEKALSVPVAKRRKP